MYLSDEINLKGITCGYNFVNKIMLLKLISLFNSHALYFLALLIVQLHNFICCCWFC